MATEVIRSKEMQILAPQVANDSNIDKIDVISKNYGANRLPIRDKASSNQSLSKNVNNRYNVEGCDTGGQTKSVKYNIRTDNTQPFDFRAEGGSSPKYDYKK